MVNLALMPILMVLLAKGGLVGRGRRVPAILLANLLSSRQCRSTLSKARAANPTGADVSGEAPVRQAAEGRGSFSRTTLFIVRHLGLCKGYLSRASSTKRSPPFTSCLGSGTVPIEISPGVLVVGV